MGNEICVTMGNYAVNLNQMYINTTLNVICKLCAVI